MVVLGLWLIASLLLAVVWALIGWILGARDLPRVFRRRRVAAVRKREPVGAAEAVPAAGEPFPTQDSAAEGNPSE